MAGRRKEEVVKRFRLIAAVGALATLTAALSGSSAYGGPSGSARGPINIGALTPLTRVHFAPWGLQARAGMAMAVNEINRSGGVKGRGQGRRLNLVVADDQSVNTNAAIDGFRRLTQQDNVVSVGGIIGSPIALATTRLAEEAKVPLFLVKAGNNEILTQSSRYTFRTCLPAAAMVAASVVQLAQRRGIRSVGVMIADYAWGQSFKSSLEEEAKVGAEHQVQHPGCAAADDELHAVPACVGRRVADRGDGPSAGRGADPGSGATARDEGAGGRCVLAVLAHREERRRRRRSAAGATSSAWPRRRRRTRPSRSATCGRSRRTSSSRTTRSPATRT